MKKITLGLTGQALGEIKTFDKIVDLAKEKYGITHFELWPVNVPGEGLGYCDRDISQIVKIKEEKKVAIDCVTQEAAFVEAAVKDENWYRQIMKGTIDAAVAVGAKVVNHYCYFINLDEKPDFDKLDRYWAEPLDYAKKRGITLVLENEAHDVTRHPETTAKIVEHFHDSAFKTNLDAVNYFHASEEGFPAAYEILKPYIGYVHLKNACLYREGAGQEKRDQGAPMSGIYEGRPIQYAPIPDGSVNIGGLINRILEDDLYHGTCTLEPHTTPDRVEYFCERETGWLREHQFI